MHTSLDAKYLLAILQTIKELETIELFDNRIKSAIHELVLDHKKNCLLCNITPKTIN